MSESLQNQRSPTSRESGGKAPGLSPKQAAFVREYIKDANATQAAIRAGYSAKTAKVQGSRLLTKADVQAALAKRTEKLEITAEYVLQGIKRIADAGDEEHNRLKAFELLGKHKKLFTDKVEHSFADMTDEQLEERLRALRAKEAATFPVTVEAPKPEPEP